MRKECRCGKIRTEDPTLRAYCNECQTYAHPAYVQNRDKDKEIAAE